MIILVKIIAAAALFSVATGAVFWIATFMDFIMESLIKTFGNGPAILIWYAIGVPVVFYFMFLRNRAKS